VLDPSHHKPSESSRSTKHTYHIRQLASGRVGWTAGDQNKRGQISVMSISEGE
jgi:hypothetical protein